MIRCANKNTGALSSCRPFPVTPFQTQKPTCDDLTEFWEPKDTVFDSLYDCVLYEPTVTTPIPIRVCFENLGISYIYCNFSLNMYVVLIKQPKNSPLVVPFLWLHFKHERQHAMMKGKTRSQFIHYLIHLLIASPMA